MPIWETEGATQEGNWPRAGSGSLGRETVNTKTHPQVTEDLNVRGTDGTDALRTKTPTHLARLTCSREVTAAKTQPTNQGAWEKRVSAKARVGQEGV